MENLMSTFAEQAFDVTNYAEAYTLACCCIITRKTLLLEPEEAVLKTSNCCMSSTQRRPYAQLNVVEKRKACFGLANAINSDLAPIDAEGNGGIVPGCGCSESYMEEISNELNKRKDSRGKIAQMRQQRYMLDKVSKLAFQIPLLLKHHGVQYPPDETTLTHLRGRNSSFAIRPLAEVAKIEHMPEFGSSTFDTTCCCESLCCTTTSLELAPDEAVLTKKTAITGSVTTTRVPYGNIESVTANKTCGCCSTLVAGELTQPSSTDAPRPIMPGSGCSSALVESIRQELQARVDARGNLGQIKQLEKMMSKFQDLAAEMALILDKLELESAYPPSQQTMLRLYGDTLPLTAAVPHQLSSQQFETKAYSVANQCLSAQLCCLTCGLCGWMESKLTLEQEQTVLETSNNCAHSVEKTPYAQLGSVDEEQMCCCRFVNGMSPGLGCSTGVVKEISEELQARKVGRGNIAQLRNQENTMVKAQEFQVRTDLLLEKRSVSYPPSQETMSAIYGEDPPRLPPSEDRPGEGMHFQASEMLDTVAFEITTNLERWCLFGQRSTLELNDEEAVFTRESCCLKSRRREPFAQLGSVEPAQCCCGGCVMVETDQNMISPGCGCSYAQVSEIAAELQHRKVKRGNIAQIRLQENLMIELIKMAVKADLLVNKEGLQYPPTPETMMSVFGEQIPVPDWQPQPRRPSRTTMEVVIPSGHGPGDVFRVRGSRGSIEVRVPDGAASGQVLEVDVSSAAATTEMTSLSRAP